MTVPTELTVNPGIPTTQRGSLDLSNPIDRYQINFTQRSSAKITLTGLTDDVNIRVLQAGNEIASGTNLGTLSEILLLNDRESGIYTIEVELAPNTGVGSYQLGIELNTEAQQNNLWWRNNSIEYGVVWHMEGVNMVDFTPFQVGADWNVHSLADLNDDGEDDIIWRNARTGTLAFWLMQNGTIADSGGYAASLDWELTQVADLDGNNRADMIWYHAPTGSMAFWLMDGTQMIGANGYYITPDWRPTRTLDANGDGKADIFMRNASTGQAVLWLMDGLSPIDGRFYGLGPEWSLQAVGDFNNDTFDDLLWRHTGTSTVRGTGTVGFWLMTGTEIAHAWGIPSVTLDWNVTAIGDLNGAGADDILWTNQTNGLVTTWLMAEDGASIGSGLLVTTLQPGFEIAGTGDFNNDQITDVVYRNRTSSLVKISLLNFNTATNTVQEIGSRDYPDVDANWRMQGVLRREITNTPFDISGRTPSEWFDLGTLNDKGVYRDTVRAGMDDYFRFNVSVLTKMTIQDSPDIEFRVAKLPDTLNLATLDISTLNWETPTPGKNLGAGNWVVRVRTAKQSVTDYALDIHGIPQITNLVGTSFSVSTSQVSLTPSAQQTTAANSNFVSVTFSVRNTGSERITGFNVGFWLSRNGDIEPTIGNNPVVDERLQAVPSQGAAPIPSIAISDILEPGQSKSFTRQVKLPDTLSNFWFVDGRYFIGMQIDPDNQIAEFGEAQGITDNYNTGFGRDKAELLVSGTETLELSSQSIRVVGGTLTPGGTVTLEYKIQNSGNKPTSRDGDVRVRFLLSADPDIDRLVDPLLLDPIGNIVGDIQAPAGGSAIGGAVNGTPAIVTQTVTLKLPELNEFDWQEEVDGQIGRRTTPFYIGVVVNRSGVSENEPDYDNNEPGDVTDKPELLGIRYLKFTI